VMLNNAIFENTDLSDVSLVDLDLSQVDLRYAILK
jgi:uncharacterized protein YjbI with pentapeptide repeats